MAHIEQGGRQPTPELQESFLTDDGPEGVDGAGVYRWGGASHRTALQLYPEFDKPDGRRQKGCHKTRVGRDAKEKMERELVIGSVAPLGDNLFPLSLEPEE